MIDSIHFIHHDQLPVYVKDIIEVLLESGADPNITDKVYILSSGSLLDLCKSEMPLKVLDLIAIIIDHRCGQKLYHTLDTLINHLHTE